MLKYIFYLCPSCDNYLLLKIKSQQKYISSSGYRCVKDGFQMHPYDIRETDTLVSEIYDDGKD